VVPATIVKNCDFRPYGFCHEYPYGLFHAMRFPIGVRHAGYHGFSHVILIGFPSVMSWAVVGNFRKLKCTQPPTPTLLLFFQRGFSCNFFLFKIIVVCHFLGMVYLLKLCVPPLSGLSFIGPSPETKYFPACMTCFFFQTVGYFSSEGHSLDLFLPPYAFVMPTFSL